MTILVWRTRSEEETVSLGRALALALVPPVWVGLTGPLGAGKTRLVQGIADGLHYPGRVRSPTFVLENRYAASVPIVHQDLYRLSDVDEEILAGWEENVDAIVLVEWAERADERPERAVSIEITPIESTTPTAETLQPEDASDSSMRPSPAGPAVTPDVAAVDDVDQQGEREIRVRFAPGLLRLDQTTRAAATEVSRVKPVLGLETSGKLTGAALAVGDRLLGECAVDIAAGREELLLALASDLLNRHGMTVADLGRIGVSLGPGSFTGIRVGVAAAQALALGAETALVGVPSHHALAYPFAGLDLAIVLLTGFRKGQVFVEVGRWEGANWLADLPGQSVGVESLEDAVVPVLERLQRPRPIRFLFLGEAVESIRERVPDLFGEGDRIASGLAMARRPGPVALLAARPEAVEATGRSIELMEPLYLRAADARKPGTR